MIYIDIVDEGLRRLLDYNRRRYWLVNRWSIRFRITEATASKSRPHGIKYAFTLHDLDGTRLLGYDNAHGIPCSEAYDHGHRFRRTNELVPYKFRGADELLCDFFSSVERACQHEGVAFEFEIEDVELQVEDEEDGTEITG
jgi:hypothetical protein